VAHFAHACLLFISQFHFSVVDVDLTLFFHKGNSSKYLGQKLPQSVSSHG
jgi:hypothetical protein